MMSKHKVGTTLGAIALPVVLVGMWWMTSTQSKTIYYPPLGKVLQTLVTDWIGPRLIQDLLPSLASLFAALAIAIVFGVVLGALIGASDILHQALVPILDLLRSAPGVALVPVALVIFGIGDASEIAVIAFVTLWPILLNVIAGVRLSMSVYDEVRRNLRMTFLQRIIHVDLPASLPQFMAGLYTSLSIGVVVMIASEYYSSVRGVGFYIVDAQQSYNVSAIFASLILLGVLGYLLSIGFRVLQRAVLRWQEVSH